MTKNREKMKILLNDFQHLVQEYLHTINKMISLVTKQNLLVKKPFETRAFDFLNNFLPGWWVHLWVRQLVSLSVRNIVCTEFLSYDPCPITHKCICHVSSMQVFRPIFGLSVSVSLSVCRSNTCKFDIVELMFAGILSQQFHVLWTWRIQNLRF